MRSWLVGLVILAGCGGAPRTLPIVKQGQVDLEVVGDGDRVIVEATLVGRSDRSLALRLDDGTEVEVDGPPPASWTPFVGDEVEVRGTLLREGRPVLEPDHAAPRLIARGEG